MDIYTIGFAKKSAEEFFSILNKAGVARLIDVRLNNVSQLAGFTKKDDLSFFLREVAKIEYVHAPLLAPKKEMLDEYRKKDSDWKVYEKEFRNLLASREVETELSKKFFKGPAVLLCSEPTAARCHRRLIVEYLGEKWGGIRPVHL